MNPITASGTNLALSSSYKSNLDESPGVAGEGTSLNYTFIDPPAPEYLPPNKTATACRGGRI